MYKHGDKIVSTSKFFKLASFITFYFIILFPAATICFVAYRYRIHGRYNLHSKKKAITVSNHTMFFDPVIIAAAAFPQKPYQTLLEASASAPFVGTLTRLLGGVPIPRHDMHFKALLAGCEEIFKNKNLLHFYPEGECYLYNGVPKRFHTGAFYVAAKLGVPVIPMATVFKKKFGRPRARVYIMPPVSSDKYNIFGEDRKGPLNEAALKEFVSDIQKMITDKIVEKGGTNEFYKGALERVKGINDEN